MSKQLSGGRRIRIVRSGQDRRRNGGSALTDYGETTIYPIIDDAPVRPVAWVGSSKRDFRAFPDEVQDVMGFALYRTQTGQWHESMKPLKGFGGSGVVELVESHQGDAYRAVYTVRFEEAVYVLHAFQKKSKSGIKTPQQDIEMIKSRLKLAEASHRQRTSRGDA
jgi:phage-related protein